MEFIAFLVVGLITGALAWRKGQNPWLWIVCGALTPAAVTIAFIILSQRGALNFLGPGMTGWYIDRGFGSIAQATGAGQIAIMELHGHWFIAIETSRTTPGERASIRDVCRQQGIWEDRIIEFTSP